MAGHKYTCNACGITLWMPRKDVCVACGVCVRWHHRKRRKRHPAQFAEMSSRRATPATRLVLRSVAAR